MARSSNSRTFAFGSSLVHKLRTAGSRRRELKQNLIDCDECFEAKTLINRINLGFQSRRCCQIRTEISIARYASKFPLILEELFFLLGLDGFFLKRGFGARRWRLAAGAKGSKPRTNPARPNEGPFGESRETVKATLQTPNKQTRTDGMIESVQKGPFWTLCLLAAARSPPSSCEVKICCIMQGGIDFPPLARCQLPAPKSQRERFAP